MQDVMPKLVNVFVVKVLLETPTCSVCHLLDLLFALRAVVEAVIANMEPQINASVILGTQAIHIQDVKILSMKLVLILNADHMLPAPWLLESHNVSVRRVILATHTTNALT